MTAFRNSANNQGESKENEELLPRNQIVAKPPGGPTISKG